MTAGIGRTLSASDPRMAIAIVGAVGFMEQFDSAAIFPAIPTLSESLNASASEVSFGVTIYLLVVAALLPLSGWLSDRFGVRKVCRVAVALFSLASLASALSQSLNQFLMARTLQGVGAAIMVPVGRILVVQKVDKKSLVKAVAAMTWPALVAPLIGAPIGGFLSTYASWRWIFIFNVPIGAILIFLVTRNVPVEDNDRGKSFDFIGYAFLAASTLCCVLSVDAINRRADGDLPPMGLAGAGVFFLAAYLLHPRRADVAIIDLSLLKTKTISVCVFAGALSRVTIGAAPYLVPLMCQMVWGMTAFETGLLMLASAMGNLAMIALTPGILKRVGFRGTLVCSGVAQALSMAVFAWMDSATPVLSMLLVILMTGITRSIQLTAFSSLVFADVESDRASAVNTLFSTSQKIAASLGVALASALLTLSGRPQGLGGEAYSFFSFQLTFLCVAGVATISSLGCCALPSKAGCKLAK